MSDYTAFFTANRDIWNQRTQVHKDSSFYDSAGFMAGKDVLTPIELTELGDVSGKHMLHLQCHFGLDTLNWVRLGASVTGIDFSEKAIAEAERLSASTGLSARFLCCNVYDLPLYLGEEQYDIVFTSFGVIGWLPDLEKWAGLIFRYLKPGGFFYLVEFHPIVWMFDDDFTHIQYPYHNSEVIITDSKGTYTDRQAHVTGKEYGWNHSLSEVIMALISKGLSIHEFHEHTYSPYPCFNNMVPAGEGRWHIRDLEERSRWCIRSRRLSRKDSPAGAKCNCRIRIYLNIM